jgi:hypothetical protein
MKVVHIESGLGNQMLSYCEFLAMRKMNPDDDIYIENIIYDIREANDYICQWNGYELDRIFHVDAPNVRELFTDVQWEEIINEIHTTQFWKRNWNYPVLFTDAFRKQGIDLKNIRGDFESPGWPRMVMSDHESLIRRVKDKLERFLPYIYLQQYVRKRRSAGMVVDYERDLFVKTDEDVFTGQRLTFKLKNSGIEQIENEIRKAFTFPEIEDERNREAMRQIQSRESVAIHVRRGDLLGLNYALYATGYFKKAVKFIKGNVSNPVFYIFCDPDSVSWAKENARVLGLNMKKDEVHFIDWNTSLESYRDMQLMAACKHQVVTSSSFGWWGAWLNTNPNKITCSPDVMINTTHNF